MGISKALGDDRQGTLALWQVFARVMEQGSRLSATRLARSHATEQLLETSGFNEDHLYENLDWLAGRQAEVENVLFAQRYPEGKRPSLYLYDVTSSYLEGQHNELAFFGYNRDGKRGKKQIVIGMLCDLEGIPVSVEVFEGNTSDTQTVARQIEKIEERFGGSGITLVGDRGMIKGPQMNDLADHNFHYITAITKAQIQQLIEQSILQASLFDIEVAEVQEENIRYIIRKNPVRAQEVRQTRQEKLTQIHQLLARENAYLNAHPRAKPETSHKRLQGKIDQLKLSKFLKLHRHKRSLKLQL